MKDSSHYTVLTRLFRPHRGIRAFFGLQRMYVRYRHRIFYTHETDPVALLRALLHPFMQIYNYRYL